MTEANDEGVAVRDHAVDLLLARLPSYGRSEAADLFIGVFSDKGTFADELIAAECAATGSDPTDLADHREQLVASDIDNGFLVVDLYGHGIGVFDIVPEDDQK